MGIVDSLSRAPRNQQPAFKGGIVQFCQSCHLNTNSDKLNGVEPNYLLVLVIRPGWNLRHGGGTSQPAVFPRPRLRRARPGSSLRQCHKQPPKCPQPIHLCPQWGVLQVPIPIPRKRKSNHQLKSFQLNNLCNTMIYNKILTMICQRH